MLTLPLLGLREALEMAKVAIHIIPFFIKIWHLRNLTHNFSDGTFISIPIILSFSYFCSPDIPFS